MEKYKELYDLSLRVMAEQRASYEYMSEKASRFITVLTLLIGGYSYLCIWILSTFDKEVISASQWILIIVGVLMFFVMVYAWFSLLKVLRQADIVSLPMTDEMLSLYKDNELEDIYYTIAKGNKEAIERNKTTLVRKSRLLNIAYYFLFTYTAMFVFVSIFYFVTKVCKL